MNMSRTRKHQIPKWNEHESKRTDNFKQKHIYIKRILYSISLYDDRNN